ncbi:uncharacterized protein LOC130968985 [Arachis stenosperma]|uniref:uncharacterized protein LOC130968985 n=1 Tax=Arachis stenosperma TaxID=217475 RepID=UPI0025ABCCDC|nr:uncharacterized protein LOC130968985 [Arachis stenosperma]
MKIFLSLTGFPAMANIFQPTNQYPPPIISVANVDASNTTINAVNHDGGSSPNVHSPNPPNPNVNISSPPLLPLPEFHSVVRVISEHQSTHYSMLLPSVFAAQAFSPRLDIVRICELHKPPIVMKLRWRSSRSSEAFLTRGWHKFSVEHGLRCGSVLRLSVSIDDEITMYITM